MTEPHSGTTQEKHDSALTTLRDALLSLKSVGSTGFEGLLASILSAYTNQPVRLFRSGYQFGQDGATSSPDTTLSLEAKQYSKSISDGTVLQKIPQFMDQANTPDLWIAGISCEANPTLKKTVHSVSEQTGIACFIFDWPPTSNAPPLVAYLMIAPQTARDFLVENAKAGQSEYAIEEAFDRLSHCRELTDAANALAIEFTAPSIGLSLARAANAIWLKEKLSSSEKARATFGQRLAPAASSAMPFQIRDKLNSEIRSRVFCTKPGDPVFVVGKQGFGKSWAVMSAWLETETPPLLLTLTANKAAELENATDLSNALAREFLTQTGAILPQLSLPRWTRRFSRWRRDPHPENARYVILIDGLNQRADANWTKIVAALQNFASSTGGQLAITVRPSLYTRLKNRLPEHKRPISVAGWSDKELHSILKNAAIDMDDLPRSVIYVLKVPRLCAIAFELFAKDQIEDFRALTIGKLLFTQVQSAEGTSLDPSDFAKDITGHAKESLSRIREQHLDPTLFEASDTKRIAIHDRLQLLCQDAFFELDPSNHTDYDILPETLSLGLAMSLVQQLKRAARRSAPLDAHCADLLEPIEAIDQTAEIVLDALLLAAADEACSDTIVETLIHAFTALQNINSELHPAFSYAARQRSAPLLSALETSVKRGSRDHNTDWLTSSAASFSNDAEARSLLEGAIARWLNQYSLDPTLGSIGRSPNDPTTEEIDEQKQKIDESLRSLSSYETGMLKNMSRVDSDISYELIEIAITLLKTLDRAPFISSLARYLLACIVNSPWHHTHDDFEALMRFNFRDWPAARYALLAEVDAIETANPSKTGRWTMVVLLEATGDADDFARAQVLRTQLEDETIKRIRAEHAKKRIYAPFDPDEVMDDDHLDAVRDRLDGVNFQNWRIDRGNTPDNHTIEEDLPYLTRFALSEAVAFQRGLIDEMLTRSDLALKMAVFQLNSESFMATPEQRDEMIAKALSLVVDHESKGNDQDWVTQQYLLLMGLADSDGDKQLETISQLPANATVLTKFDDIIRRPNASLISLKLSDAIESGAANAIVKVLLFTKTLSEDFSNSLIMNCEALLKHENTFVRAYTMRALIALNNQDLLVRFANSGWSAANLHPKQNYYERWFGEQLLIAAAKSGALEVPDLIPRITPRHYARALQTLGDSVTPYILDVLDKAFEIQLDDQEEEPPIIKARFAAPSDVDPSRVALIERETISTDPIEMLREHSETEKQFQDKQKARSVAYSDFFETMTEKRAEDLLGDVGFTTIRACAERAPDRVTDWANQVLSSRGWKRRALKPIGLHIAQALSAIAPERSSELYSTLLKTDGFVRFHTGTAEIEHDAIALWSGADIDSVSSECLTRLDNCSDDGSIHLEVLAALHAKRTELVRSYCEDRLSSGHPMKICRALIVAATANITPNEIDRYLGTPGPIGTAAKKASDIQSRGKAMSHWWDCLCRADSDEAFGQASLLLQKCIDARFDLLETRAEDDSLAERYLPFLDQELRKAIERSEKQLGKTLFGGRVPKTWFVQLSPCS